jgi:hypothetical protein
VRIEYAALRYVGQEAVRSPPETPEGRRRLRKSFQKFGLHRALKLAGVTPGTRVRLGSLQVLWEPPEDIGDISGIADYDYVVALPIARLTPAALEAEARRVAPLLLARLIAS